jgi:hypothetical protein
MEDCKVLLFQSLNSALEMVGRDQVAQPVSAHFAALTQTIAKSMQYFPFSESLDSRPYSWRCDSCTVTL